MARFYACVEILVPGKDIDDAHEFLVETLGILEECGEIVNFQFRDWDKPWQNRGVIQEVPEDYDFSD